MSGSADITVVAPVPWVPPGIAKIFPRYSGFAGVENVESTGPLIVYHPRYVTFPKILKFLDGLLMMVAVMWFLARRGIRWNFDIIDAHWLYPDGAAAVLIGKIRDTPVTVTVRGDDIRTFSRYRLRRRMLEYTLRNAAWVWTVCDDLRKWVERIVPGLTNVEVSLNGVDTRKFHPADRSECRKRLRLPECATILLAVGRIEPAKGQMVLLEALRGLSQRGREYHLVFVGPVDDKEYANRMKEFAVSTGLEARVIWTGPQGHELLSDWLCSADVFLMASENEGCPNSLIEAMACQVPIVVHPVGGIPEIISEGVGCIFVQRTAEAFVRGIEEMVNRVHRSCGNSTAIHQDIRSWGTVSRQVLERLEKFPIKASG